MGYFSYTCAKTGLPIISSDSGVEDKFFRIAVLEPDGSIIKGNYDGYGRVVNGHRSFESGELKDAKYVLAHFWKGEAYEALGKSWGDPEQGAYVPAFTPLMFEAQERNSAFDGHQYIARLREFRALEMRLQPHMDILQGLPYGALYSLLHALGKSQYHEASEGHSYLQAAWARETEGLPVADPARYPELHRMEVSARIQALLDTRDKALAIVGKEVVRAWEVNEPTRAPNFEAIALGDAAAAWSTPTGEVAAAARRRPRP